uniref:uncharacterized protein LOC122609913 n=1 Tax=Erigeron canadensis TaxID=72917 RepID=UPI001CB88F66|nr:uncharacterized protein LOC122609913 [Erigeron canadensis]
MDDTIDFEEVLEDEPHETGEIANIDEHGYLVGLESESEDINVDLGSEEREDIVEHVNIESEIFEDTELTGQVFEDDNIMGKVFDTVDDAYIRWIIMKKKREMGSQESS